MRDSDKIRMLVREAFVEEGVFSHIEGIGKNRRGQSDKDTSNSGGWASHLIFDKSNQQEYKNKRHKILKLILDKAQSLNKEELQKKVEEFNKEIERLAYNNRQFNDTVNAGLKEISRKIREYFANQPNILNDKDIKSWYQI